MSEWKEYKFSDLAYFVSEKINTNILSIEKYISTDNMLPNLGGVSIAEKLSTNNKCNAFLENDILFSNIRTYFKKVWLANFEGGCSADVLVIRTKDKNIALNEYLYLIISSDNFIQYTVASSKGTKMPRGDKSAILDYRFFIPNIEIQKKIVEQYFSLDQKITLNTQINQTLEQIAQATFKSWFIEFDPVHAKANALANGETEAEVIRATMEALTGKTSQELDRLQTENPTVYEQFYTLAQAFPSEFEDVEGYGKVPKGWVYAKADNLFDIGIGKTPPRKEPEWFSENTDDVQWISIKDMGNSGTYVTNSSEYLTREAIDNFNIKKIPENTVILSFKLTVGRIAITTCETTTNEAIAHFKLNEKKSYLSTEFLYLYFKQFDFKKLGSTSSIATAVNSKTIKELRILYPNLEVISLFDNFVSKLFLEIKNLTEENESLIKIRDLLLPKLLSGEI